MWWAFIAYFLWSSVVSCDPVITIEKGSVRGQVLKSRDGRNYYSFTSIPYAKPPIDELRFKVRIFLIII